LPPGVAVHPELAGDLGGGRRLVAGDHHGADARLAARGDRGPGLLAERVDHPDQPHEGVFAAQVHLAIPVGQVPAGQGQDPQGAGGQLVVGVEGSAAVLVGQGPGSVRADPGPAGVEHRAGRPLEIGHRPTLGRPMRGDHAFRRAVEGDLAEPGIVALQGGLLHPRLGRRDDQGPLGRVAEHGGAAVALLDLRVVAQGADPQGQRQQAVAIGGDDVIVRRNSPSGA
jgi:hypothetical protein